VDCYPCVLKQFEKSAEISVFQANVILPFIYYEIDHKTVKSQAKTCNFSTTKTVKDHSINLYALLINRWFEWRCLSLFCLRFFFILGNSLILSMSVWLGEKKFRWCHRRGKWGGAAAPPGDILAPPWVTFAPPETCILGHFCNKKMIVIPSKTFFFFGERLF